MMLVDVWMKKVGKTNYDEYVETKKFKVRRDWNYTFFRFHLKKPGDYKYIIYNENEKIIKSAFISASN
jgi:hypothetical protein